MRWDKYKQCSVFSVLILGAVKIATTSGLARKSASPPQKHRIFLVVSQFNLLKNSLHIGA